MVQNKPSEFATAVKKIRQRLRFVYIANNYNKERKLKREKCNFEKVHLTISDKNNLGLLNGDVTKSGNRVFFINDHDKLDELINNIESSVLKEITRSIDLKTLKGKRIVGTKPLYKTNIDTGILETWFSLYVQARKKNLNELSSDGEILRIKKSHIKKATSIDAYSETFFKKVSMFKNTVIAYDYNDSKKIKKLIELVGAEMGKDEVYFEFYVGGFKLIYDNLVQNNLYQIEKVNKKIEVGNRYKKNYNKKELIPLLEEPKNQLTTLSKPTLEKQRDKEARELIKKFLPLIEYNKKSGNITITFTSLIEKVPQLVDLLNNVDKSNLNNLIIRKFKNFEKYLKEHTNVYDLYPKFELNKMPTSKNSLKNKVVKKML